MCTGQSTGSPGPTGPASMHSQSVRFGKGSSTCLPGRTGRRLMHRCLQARRAAAMYGYANSLKAMAAVPDTAGADKPDVPLPAPESHPQYAGVIASYREVIQRYPHTEFAARSYLQIGLIQFEKDFDLDGALASFDRVRAENPASATITYEVALKAGQVLTARGDTTAAMTRYLSVAQAPAAHARPERRGELPACRAGVLPRPVHGGRSAAGLAHAQPEGGLCQ